MDSNVKELLGKHLNTLEKILNDLDTGNELDKEEVEDVVITAYCVYQDMLGCKRKSEGENKKAIGSIEDDRFQFELIGKEDGITDSEDYEGEKEQVEVEEIFKGRDEVEEIFKSG